MKTGKFIVSISGHGESGKDEFAVMLAEAAGLKYLESTSEIIKEAWWTEIQRGEWSTFTARTPITGPGTEKIFVEPDEYPNIEAFYADRRNRREEWKAYIGAYNWCHDSEHGIATYKHTLARGNQFLCGIRQQREFLACREHLIDLSIWIDRPGTPVDSTQEYGAELCSVIVRNCGTLDDLRQQAVFVAEEYIKPRMS